MELAATAGLATGAGVTVDALLRTADPAISAIGDCAAYPGPQGARPLESVQAAVDGARCVAARLVGRAAPYAALPWFWSDQGGLRLQIAGLGGAHDAAVLRGDGKAFSTFLFRDGLLAAVESVNRPVDHVQARRILAAGGQLSPVEAADAGFALRDVGRAA
jgi:3-phenylpropionate/trans-cinnamate dioxygenase ferredoxin reductase subunit